MLRFTIIPINPTRTPLPITERENSLGEEVYYVPPFPMYGEECPTGYGEDATMQITDAIVCDEGGVVDMLGSMF